MSASSGSAPRNPRLLIQWPDGHAEYELDKAEITFGRDADNYIVVASPIVSRHHALLVRVGSTFNIVDKHSTNGLMFNGQGIRERMLQHHDVIRIGDPLGNLVSLQYDNPALNNINATPTSKLELTQTTDVVIGRLPQCQVVLSHPSVSQRHARIETRDGRHVIVDLNSTNGTFVNGLSIQRHPLQRNDIVQIGPYRLTYDGVMLQTYAEGEQIRLDAFHLYKTIQLRNEPQQVLLNNISLSIQPREFVALVGSSGAGKSTLMDALNGFRQAQSGAVRLNGDDLYLHIDLYRAMLGYVPQDDTLHRDLTVESAMRYAAELRLPNVSTYERQQLINSVLSDVEISHRRTTLIKRLSGGERKRVNIGVELLAKPGLFFLDEPTSGLDPGLEKKMMFMLRQLADKGHTIVLVTHATANISQCDHVAFMARGRLCFFGPPSEALRFFKALDFSDIYNELNSDEQSPARWEKSFHESSYYLQYVVNRLHQPLAAQPAPTTRHTRTAPRDSWLRQFSVLSRRYAELIVHDKFLLSVLLAVMPIIGVLLLLIGHKLDLVGDLVARNGWTPSLAPYTPAISAQKLLLMVALAVVLLGMFAAAYEVIKEYPVYRRERMINLRLVPYLLSKLAVLSVFALVQCLTLLFVVQLGFELPKDGVFVAAPLELYATLVLADVAGIALGLLISTLSPSSNMVVYVMLLVLFLQIIFAGAIFDLPDVVKPISSLTLTYWTLDALGSTANLSRLNDTSKPRAIDLYIDYEHTSFPFDESMVCSVRIHHNCRWNSRFGFEGT